MFNPEELVTHCQAAAAEVNPVAAVQEVVASAIADGASIDAALGTEFKGEADTLFSSVDLTVQRIQWPPGIHSSMHDHRMWAVVGVYVGQELNRIYRRSPDGIEERGHRALGEGDVLVLNKDAIHSVENSLHRRTAGLHVYGGDILSIERSAWGPDEREVSFPENASPRRAMYEAMREVAGDHGMQLDDQARYLAITALQFACEREQRYPRDIEARRIVAEVWNLAP